MVNDAIKNVKNNPKRGLYFQKLDKPSLHLVVYTDSSFSNNDDLTTKLGYCIFPVSYTHLTLPTILLV